jgi:hypothetical protein
MQSQLAVFLFRTGTAALSAVPSALFIRDLSFFLRVLHFGGVHVK